VKRASPAWQLLSALCWTLLCNLCAAQQRVAVTRITAPINETKLTVLSGNTHPLARPDSDRGSAAPNLALNRMLLVLRRSREQEGALTELLNNQQQKSSPQYHSWLTPEKFAELFGSNDQDVRTITSWLSSHGLLVNSVARGRQFIEFSGTAAQVKEVFQTEIHRYEINGKEHWANATDPKLPTALAPVVAGIVSLHNFGRKPMHIARRKVDGLDQPRFLFWNDAALFTGNSVCGIWGGCYGVAPYDFATIYNVLPLWTGNPPVDGTGITIAIVGQSQIYSQDVADFRSAFGLPPSNLNIITDGPQPGVLVTEGDELESDIDVELSGSIAKGATIDLVVSASTDTTAGVDLSALDAVDNNIAPIISDSYGACELDMGVTGNQFYFQLWQQAAAQGITVFVASGDSGAAGCDRGSQIATQGLAVNGIASTPFNIAVGGTDFNDFTDYAKYWSPTNNPVTQQSALSYIPEMTWNDTCTNSEFFTIDGTTSAESECNDTTARYWGVFRTPIGGGGGASNCTAPTGNTSSSCFGGYQKPSWQTGIGVPNDGRRDVPDVSLFAADGMNGNFYVVCQNGSCSGGNARGAIAIGGTSAAAPEFAGILALVNQKTGSRQGLANYVLYPLAAQQGATCDSSGPFNGSCTFYDLTSGTIAVPCTTGTADCVTNVSGDQNGVLSGYSTAAGYDLPTGLGSVNVANLVNNWSTVSFQPTISSLSLSPTTISHGSAVNLSVSVAPQSGAGLPTGSVSLLTSAGPSAGVFTLQNGSIATTTTSLPGGKYTVSAHYAGDGTYAASDSTPAILVDVAAEPSKTAVQAFTLDQNGKEVPFSNGTYGASVIYLRTNVAGQSGQGVPTGSVNITETANGTSTSFPGNPYVLNSEGYTMTPLPGYFYQAFMPGTYSFTASYGGDTSFNTSISSPSTLSVTRAPTNITTTITPCTGVNGVCSFQAGDSVPIFEMIQPSSIESISNPPTGTVTFYSNGKALGPAASIDTAVYPPTAYLQTTQLLGNNSITAQYSGDSNYLGSTSAAELVAVGPTFEITTNQNVITVASPGQSGSTVLTFAAQNGFSGSAALTSSTCSGLPTGATCSFGPGVVTFTSSATIVPVSLTIATTGMSFHSIESQSHSRPGVASYGILITGVWGAALIFPPSHLRRLRRAARFSVIFVMLALALACGGGGNNGSGRGPGGTPIGTYGITVAATINGVTQSINTLSLNVK
jgi:hypothetical protein